MKEGSGIKKKMGIDEVLQTHAGEFGRWQMKQFVLTSLAWALEAFHTMVMIFADREPEWRCAVGSKGVACRAAGGVEAGLCGLPKGSWEWIGEHAASTVSEWGLVCGERYKIGLVQSAFFGGCMVGNSLSTTFFHNFLILSKIINRYTNKSIHRYQMNVGISLSIFYRSIYLSI